MITAVVSLILLCIAFFVISAVVFCKPEAVKKKAVLFMPFSRNDTDSIEHDIRMMMKNINLKYIEKIYLVNLDDDIGVLKICRILCREYDILDICSEEDVLKILEE